MQFLYNYGILNGYHLQPELKSEILLMIIWHIQQFAGYLVLLNKAFQENAFEMK